MKRIMLLAAVLAIPGAAADSKGKLPADSKVFVQPMDGFGSYIIAALNKKQVPLIVVNDREKADFEIAGNAESQKAGWAKILIARSAQSSEEASINITNVQSGQVVFAYNVNKGNAARGKQSAAEACAKHIKEVVGR